jgi:hypothetical protein
LAEDFVNAWSRKEGRLFILSVKTDIERFEFLGIA